MDNNLIKKYLKSFYGSEAHIKNIQVNDNLISELIEIDNIRNQIFQNIKIGILYKKKGQNTRSSIFSNKNTNNTQWNTFLNHIDINSEEKETKIIWQKKQISYYLGTKLNKEECRQYIGNCMSLIIFDESEESFNPLDYEWGNVTNFICVVKPYNNYYRLGFYCYYSCNIKALTSIQHISSSILSKNNKPIKELTSIVENLKIKPYVPYNYVFNGTIIKDFILAKIYNAIIMSSIYHPMVKIIILQPVRLNIEQFVEKYFTEQVARKKNNILEKSIDILFKKYP